uniref:KANL3/Tex30 alpha/beta hydrolase-like domain-containing protein n=1 Tax=Astyanax mexicanus TaxID=7994 RepID=A0A8B9KT98_ASTMX
MKMVAVSEEKVKIPFGAKVLDGILTIPEVNTVKTGVVLTHGAGGDMNLKALQSLASCTATSGILCLRFTCKGLNLTYRVRAFQAVVDYLKTLERFSLSHVFLAGRSMGARAAVALGRQLSAVDEDAVQGLVCVSFPLHPPGQTHTHVKRSEDLRALCHVPVLFVSGTADNMCEQKLLENVLKQMKSPSSVHWVEEANHGLAVKGRNEESVLEEVNSQIITWIQKHV